MNGALLIDKPKGMTSFGVLEEIQKATGLRKREQPKMGHGGTLDPFATGLLVVCAGRAVKLARYFLGSTKTYEGIMRFGETTLPGDPTAEISERSERFPSTLEEIRDTARKFTLQPYAQIPPMHSAKKVDGKPLYELARQGIEIDREPKICHIYSFEILSYEKPHARFRVSCSSGTYIRTLAQDLGKMMGTVAMLDSLHRAGSGALSVTHAQPLEAILETTRNQAPWDELPCWVPFHRLLDGYDRAEATSDETLALQQGRQNVLFNILKRVERAPVPTLPDLPVLPNINDERSTHVAIYSKESLVAVAAQTDGVWGIERVFV